ncbi:MAG: type VI secretion system baseplate subunit TssE [Lysobacter sp.]|nr:type VI secretion system baseplate subunit TssE [Lysobacter sp.]
MQFLFERLSVLPRNLDGRSEPFDQVAAVIAQIQRIASTARSVGDSVAVVPWGMRSVPTMGASATLQIEAFAKTLGDAIARYEPRLKSVQVSVERHDDPLSPYGLLVSAIFPDEDQPRNVRVAAPF